MAGQTTLRIGTRKSPLARWQAEWVAEQLTRLGVAVELVWITTEGDTNQRPLGEIGGTGLFTKAIQQALLSGDIDLAVHSLKDLPTQPIARLALAAVPQREACGDVLVARQAESFEALPPKAIVGTGSARRQAQLLRHRPDLRMTEIRGNVETRLKKLEEGEVDALILAEAGLNRLCLAGKITQVLPKSLMLPAAGQGALGLEVREEDQHTMQQLAPLNDRVTHAAVVAERAVLAQLRAGCLAPVGAWARLVDHAQANDSQRLRLDAIVLDATGTQVAEVGEEISLEIEKEEAIQQAHSLGQRVADQLLNAGAAKLMADTRLP